jgi:GH35 family endo-1,4-beta-xylanase
LKYKDSISSVTIWGICDNVSWRKNYAPLLFGTGVSDKKPAFDALVDAVTNYSSESK